MKHRIIVVAAFALASIAAGPATRPTTRPVHPFNERELRHSIMIERGSKLLSVTHDEEGSDIEAWSVKNRSGSGTFRVMLKWKRDGTCWEWVEPEPAAERPEYLPAEIGQKA